MKVKQLLLAILCLAVIATCVVWTWRTQFAAPKFNVALHVGLGQVMAEETARATHGTGKVVVVTLDPGAFPELKVQMQQFKKVLVGHPGISLKEYQLDTEERPKFHYGAGLSSRRYVRMVNKNLAAAAFVSFVGAPDLTEKDVAELKASPKLIAECRSSDKLEPLFARKAIHTAVVGRFQYPTPIKGTPRTPREWVEQRFQIVNAETAAALSAAAGDTDAVPQTK